MTRARAQASAPGGDAARPRRRGGRAARDPDRAADRHAPRSRRCSRTLHAYALDLPDQPERRRAAARGDGRARARRPRPRQRDGRRDRAGHRAPRSRELGVIADVVPPRSIAESLVESLREVDVAAARCWSPAPPRPATCCPRRCAERGAEVDVVPLYETVRERPPTSAIERGRRGRLRHLHLLLDRAATSLETVGDGLPGRRPGRLDRPGDERDGPRARPRGRRRGRAPRPRRARRGARARRGGE